MITTIFILLAASFAAVVLVRRLGLSPIVGFLAVGVLVGPHGAGVLPDAEPVRQLGEFGIVFLMFTIGLEFSLSRLVADRFLVLVLGGLQVVVTAAVAGPVAWAAGLPPGAALVVAVALAMSSTAIVSRLLLEPGEVNSRYGRAAICILLFQDLATIIFLMVLPVVIGTQSGAPGRELALTLAKGAAVFFVLLFAGRLAARPLFRYVAALHSPELFMLAVLTVSVGAAAFAHAMGLSLALGGFMAGMVLGETEFRHQVEADIRPFQDVLLGVFFITVGMLVNLAGLAGIWPAVLLVTVSLVLVKGLVVLLLARLTGSPMAVAVRTGVTLAHAGEFGLVILFLAMQMDMLTGPPGQVILLAVLLSMVAAPLLIRYSIALTKVLAGVSLRRSREATAGGVERTAQDLSDHVILCGHGSVGQNMARYLTEEGVEYIALDLDLSRLAGAGDPGERVTYGDATQRHILVAAGLERAQAVVITYDDVRAALRTLSHVHALRPDLPTLVRTLDEEHLDDLLDAGAAEVVPDTLESSLTLAAHVLTLLGVPVARVAERSDRIRADRYRLLRGVFHDRKAADSRDRVRVVTVPDGAPAVGSTLRELGLSDLEVRVTAVRRKGIRGADPDADMVVRADDALILHGSPEGLDQAETRLRGESPREE